MLKRVFVRGIVISNTCVKLYRNWIINEVARAGEHTNERTYVLTYIRTGQTLYPLHNFVVRGDNKIIIKDPLLSRALHMYKKNLRIGTEIPERSTDPDQTAPTGSGSEVLCNLQAKQM